MKFLSLPEMRTESKIMMAVGGAVLVGAALIYFVILPTIERIQEVNEDIQSQRAEVERKYKQRKKVGELAEQVDTVMSQVSWLNKPFVLDSRKLEFVTSLEQLAAEKGVEQDLELEISDSEEKDFYEVIPITITTSGSFDRQLDYLVGLETLSEYINIRYLKMGSKRLEKEVSEEEGEEINMLILADTYWAEEIEP